MHFDRFQIEHAECGSANGGVFSANTSQDNPVPEYSNFGTVETTEAPGSTRIMTTEPTQPQPEQGPTPDNGQVQSQGHRRRRRRRKNKSSQQGGQPAQQPQGQVPNGHVKDQSQ